MKTFRDLMLLRTAHAGVYDRDRDGCSDVPTSRHLVEVDRRANAQALITCCTQPGDDRYGTTERAVPGKAIHRVATFPGSVVVGTYTLLDMLGIPAVSPIARLFLETGPIAWLRLAAQKLPAYGALVALAVPFVLAEPAKIYGLVLIGQGHVVFGVLTIIAAYLVSLLLVDTIFEGARPQLRSIAWFARLLDWASLIRSNVTSFVVTSRPCTLVRHWFVRA